MAAQHTPGRRPRRRPRRLALLLAAAAASVPLASAQMQFEIPVEMLQGMMGGGMQMGGGRRGKKQTEWPKSESPDIAPEFEWLVNTEWKGKTAKYMLMRDGFVESPLKECEDEGQCLWAANNGRVMINTPTLGVIKFTVEGLEQADKKKLHDKQLDELKKVVLQSLKPSKSGQKSQLKFERLALADNEESVDVDLYEALGLSETCEEKEIKSSYRKLSIKHHPDKGGDPKKFNDIREAYETLSDPKKRKYYDAGGFQLVKNVDNVMKGVDSEILQMDAQLNQVPKNHPQYRQAKQQIDAKKREMEQNRDKIVKEKVSDEDIDIMVPVPVNDLYSGAVWKNYQYPRLKICRGCRNAPDKPECQECGRCPPEKIKVPKYGMTPFGRQVVGMKDKEQESLERCKEVPETIPQLKIPAGAKDGTILGYAQGHQTPGRLPGRAVMKLQRGSPDDKYAISETDLYTVLPLSLEEALFGFSVSWKHLGNENVKIKRTGVTQEGTVVKARKKGLVEKGGSKRGDLYVRLTVEMPQVPKGSKELKLQAPTSEAATAESRLRREDMVELRDGTAWRSWPERNTAASVESKKGDKEEL